MQRRRRLFISRRQNELDNHRRHIFFYDELVRVADIMRAGNGFVVVAAATLLLASCSGLKGTVVPSDPSKWDTIADSVKKLSDEDKQLFTGYAMRMTIGSAMAGGKGSIPPGTTIGDAIKAQREFLDKQKQEEAQAELLKAKVAAQRAQEVAKLNNAVTVALANMTVLPKSYDAGRFSDRLSLLLAVQNHTSKAVSGVKGRLVFKDQFGSDITGMTLSLDEDITPNSARSINGYGKDINQFEDSDTKLAVTPLSKMKVTFEPEMVVFADGTKMEAPEATGT